MKIVSDLSCMMLVGSLVSFSIPGYSMDTLNKSNLRPVEVKYCKERVSEQGHGKSHTIKCVEKKQARYEQNDQARYEQNDQARYEQNDQARYEQNDQARYEQNDQARYEQNDQARYEQNDQARYEQNDQARYDRRSESPREQIPVRWVNYGQYRSFNLFPRIVSIDLKGRQISELGFRAIDATIEVISAVAYLVDGRHVDLTPYTGQYINEGDQRSARVAIDQNLPVNRIEFSIHSKEFRPLRFGFFGLSVGFAD